MTKQFRSVAFGACIATLLPIDAPAAQAKQCSVALPSNPKAHWTYRIIDGRKCWYEGNNVLPKSLLRWPARAPAQSVIGAASGSDAAPITVLTVKPNNPLDSQAWAPDDSDSFEARWRAILN